MTNEYIVTNVTREIVVAFPVSVAGTSLSRKQGLLGIDRLPAGNGLWIAPCEAVHTVGMKMPIDVIFLDRAFRVTKLVPALKPFRIALSLRACSVLELEAGAIRRSKTEVGDCLRFSAT